MQAALATVEDLATLTKKTFATGSDELAQAELLLQMASAWARSKAKRLWPTPDDISDSKRDTVIGIILAAVRRELANPKRVTYEVYGPNTASYNQAACPPGFFTDEETAFLNTCSVHGNWYIQNTYRDDHRETVGYLRATNLRDPIPMFAPGDPGHGDAYFR